MDYLAKYNPTLMDSEYMDRKNWLYSKGYTKMPNEIDFTFDSSNTANGMDKETV